MHYMSYIQPFPTFDAQLGSDASPASPRLSNPDDRSRAQGQASPVVILGGYSYGSLILRHLPPVPTILQPFVAPLSGSSADEILLRAHSLADQSNLAWINIAKDEARAKRKSRDHNHTIMGGEETTPEKRRTSRDIHRSLDNHTSLKIRSRLRSGSHRRRVADAVVTSGEQHRSTITMPDIRYLLISPLTLPVSTLLAPALGHKFWHKAKEGCQEIIGKHSSLAVYGDQDAFSSAKKLRDWSALLKTEAGSQVSNVEIAGAGHFWVEHQAEEELIATLLQWEGRIR